MTQNSQLHHAHLVQSSPAALKRTDGDRRMDRMDGSPIGLGDPDSEDQAMHTATTPVEQKPMTAALRSRPDRLELVSLLTVASALLGFVVLVAAVVIPRPVVAPLIGLALAAIFGARLISAAGRRPPAFSAR